MNFVSGAALMYYEVRQALLQNGIKSIITKQGKRQKVVNVYYKECYLKVILLIPKVDNFFNKKGKYCKVEQLLQSS